MLISPIVRNIISGESGNDKAFDTPAYENALKNTGYTDEEARAYWTPRQDPFSQESLSDYVSLQTPKVSIENNNITISAPEEVLKSPFVAQLQKELSSLKGVDLKSPEIKNTIDQLNKEIQTNYTESIKEAIGWTQQEYEDYQRAVQATSVSNPMKSFDYLKWGPDGTPITDEQGKIIIKTPEEWIAYWRENYNADERTDLFKKSLQSNKPYERTMALVMAGPGGTNPVYGYSQDERIGQFLQAAASEMGKLPEGLSRLLSEDYNTRSLESLQKKTGVPVEALRRFDINDESKFNTEIGNISGKSWSDLSDNQKAFVLEVGVSKENSMLPTWQRGAITQQQYSIDDIYSDDSNKSKEAIKSILENSSFDKYKEVRNNYDTWQGYSDWSEEDDERLAKNAIWSGVSSNAGRVVGVIGRFLWENALLKGATGGISAKSLLNPNLTTGRVAQETARRGLSMNRISDDIGAKAVTWINDKKIPLLSDLSQNTLAFTSRLLGTVPEDILQMAVDNVVTYNSDENENLLNPTQLSENFRNNLIIMSLFNAARVGYNQVKLAKLAKQMEKAADLNTPLDISGVIPDADDLARAANQGQRIVVDDDGVSIIDTSGNKKVLESITPEQGKIVQQSVAKYNETGEVPRVRFDQEVVTDKNGNIDFDNFKRVYIIGDTPSPRSIRALSNYQSEVPISTKALNRYLRDNGRALPESANPKTRALDKGLSNAFTRNIAPGGVVTYSGLTDNVLIDKFKGANIGDKLDIDIYLSTSAKPNVAQSFANDMPDKIVLRIYTPGGTPVAYMPKDISPRGNGIMENELLFPDGMELTVVGKHNGDNLGKGYDGLTVFDVVANRPTEGATARIMPDEASTSRAIVEVDSPDGLRRVETPDYRFRDREDVLKTTPEPTEAGLTQYHNRGMDTLMEEFSNTHLPEFQNKFGDVQVSDFDWALFGRCDARGIEGEYGRCHQMVWRTTIYERFAYGFS